MDERNEKSFFFKLKHNATSDKNWTEKKKISEWTESSGKVYAVPLHKT